MKPETNHKLQGIPQHFTYPLVPPDFFISSASFLVDKSMKLMMFATGHIYKRTGSGFEHIDGGNNGRIAVPRRRSKMVLGKEIILDAETEWRVKWAQRGIGTFCFVGALCFIFGLSTRNNNFQISAIVCGGIVLLCFIFLLYKNISFVMMKRLFKEPNVTA